MCGCTVALHIFCCNGYSCAVDIFDQTKAYISYAVAPPGELTRTHEPFCTKFSLSIQVKQMTVQMKNKTADKLRLVNNKACKRFDDEKYKFAV